jgi:hypothetical protein
MTHQVPLRYFVNWSSTFPWHLNKGIMLGFCAKAADKFKIKPIFTRNQLNKPYCQSWETGGRVSEVSHGHGHKLNPYKLQPAKFRSDLLYNTNITVK